LHHAQLEAARQKSQSVLPGTPCIGQPFNDDIDPVTRFPGSNIRGNWKY
jgi:hypothetical protein